MEEVHTVLNSRKAEINYLNCNSVYYKSPEDTNYNKARKCNEFIKESDEQQKDTLKYEEENGNFPENKTRTADLCTLSDFLSIASQLRFIAVDFETKSIYLNELVCELNIPSPIKNHITYTFNEFRNFYLKMWQSPGLLDRATELANVALTSKQSSDNLESIQDYIHKSAPTLNTSTSFLKFNCKNQIHNISLKLNKLYLKNNNLSVLRTLFSCRVARPIDMIFDSALPVKYKSEQLVRLPILKKIHYRDLCNSNLVPIQRMSSDFQRFSQLPVISSQHRDIVNTNNSLVKDKQQISKDQNYTDITTEVNLTSFRVLNDQIVPSKDELLLEEEITVEEKQNSLIATDCKCKTYTETVPCNEEDAIVPNTILQNSESPVNRPSVTLVNENQLCFSQIVPNGLVRKHEVVLSKISTTEMSDFIKVTIEKKKPNSQKRAAVASIDDIFAKNDLVTTESNPQERSLILNNDLKKKMKCNEQCVINLPNDDQEVPDVNMSEKAMQNKTTSEIQTNNCSASLSSSQLFKACRRPIRVGLSKKQLVTPLHKKRKLLLN